MSSLSIKTKGTLLSVLIFIFVLLLWHVSTTPKVSKSNTAAIVSNTNSAEYNELMGNSLGNTVQKTGFPSLQQMGSTFYKQLAHPFYDNGPNDKGIGIQLAHSLSRVGLGFLLAMPLFCLLSLKFALARSLRSDFAKRIRLTI